MYNQIGTETIRARHQGSNDRTRNTSNAIHSLVSKRRQYQPPVGRVFPGNGGGKGTRQDALFWQELSSFPQKRGKLLLGRGCSRRLGKPRHLGTPLPVVPRVGGGSVLGKEHPHLFSEEEAKRLETRDSFSCGSSCSEDRKRRGCRERGNQRWRGHGRNAVSLLVPIGFHQPRSRGYLLFNG